MKIKTILTIGALSVLIGATSTFAADVTSNATSTPGTTMQTKEMRMEAMKKAQADKKAAMEKAKADKKAAMEKAKADKKAAVEKAKEEKKAAIKNYMETKKALKTATTSAQ